MRSCYARRHNDLKGHSSFSPRWSAASKLSWSKIALNRWMTTDNLWNRKALSLFLSRHLTGRRSFSRDPSKTDKLSHWVDQATPSQLAGRHTYPPNQNIWRFWAQPHFQLLRRPPLPLLPHYESAMQSAYGRDVPGQAVHLKPTQTTCKAGATPVCTARRSSQVQSDCGTV